MNALTWLITGGFAKGHRTQVLGVTTALSAIALWAVGDMSLADLLESFRSRLAASVLPRSAPRSTTPRRRRRKEPSPPRQNEAAWLCLAYDLCGRPVAIFPECLAFMPRSCALP